MPKPISFLLRPIRTRYFLWVILSFPFVDMVAEYNLGQLFYGEVIHASGEMSVRLLIVALLATPLLLMFPGKSFPRWLMTNRRYFGVASFSYAALHTLVYLEKVDSWPDVVADAKLPDFWTGWVALLILLVLATISNDRSVRWLKRGWKKLHRFVYLAVVLLFVHWVLVAFNRGPATAHLALLGAFEGYRIWKLRRISTTGADVDVPR